MNSLAVIIVSFNCREALRACLRSLPPGRIVVVDNASTDDSAAMVRAEFPSVMLIANQINRGFAAACNQGIAATTEPFALLLNPDTLHAPTESLVNFMRAHPNVGACGPRILNTDGTVQISCRRFPTLCRMALAELGCRWFYYNANPGENVDQFMGSCLMLRRAALEQVGWLDERFFLYFEEVDLCRRLKHAGWRVCFVQDATVTHAGGQSSKTVCAEALRERYRSLFAYYRKHHRPWQLFVLKCAVQLGARLRQGDYAPDREGGLAPVKILFLPQTCELGPSSRYRVYQLVPLLEQMGIACEIAPAIDRDMYTKIYHSAGGSRLNAFRAVWRQRNTDMKRLDDFDAVVVQKGVFPGLYSGFERIIASRKPLVFDFDDAIWLPREGGNFWLRRLHSERKVQEVLGYATAVIAGNGFLAKYARRFNRHVTVVPSAVDVSRYPQAAGNTTVGWIGSRTTLPYLAPLRPVFEGLGIKPRVIASGTPEFPAEFRTWSLETEVAELAQLGIGIAPLPDNAWERGKCGVKILQYMACGLPVVASPVGANAEIVRDGVTGFLARDAAEWTEKLRWLMVDGGLRAAMGRAGRELVEQRYSVSAAAKQVAAECVRAVEWWA